MVGTVSVALSDSYQVMAADRNGAVILGVAQWGDGDAGEPVASPWHRGPPESEVVAEG